MIFLMGADRELTSLREMARSAVLDVFAGGGRVWRGGLYFLVTSEALIECSVHYRADVPRLLFTFFLFHHLVFDHDGLFTLYLIILYSAVLGHDSLSTHSLVPTPPDTEVPGPTGVLLSPLGSCSRISPF